MTAPIHAMLLAAGLSTRLGPLSEQRPKPLLPVNNRPLIRWGVDLFQHHGVSDFVVNLHLHGEKIREELGSGTRNAERGTRSGGRAADGVGTDRFTIAYSVEEPEILGTGGGIKRMAAMMPRQTCLVANAKIICDVDLSAVLELHRRSGALATMVVRPDEHAERWGAIGVDPEGRVRRLLEQRGEGAEGATARMFTGIHVLEPEFIDRIPDGPCCVIRTAYEQLFREGAPISGYVHRGYFYDHSTPARYLQGNINLLEGRARLDHARTPLTGVHSAAFVDPTATLVEPLLLGPGARVEAGATVGPRVVLGKDATVSAGVELSHSVVWDSVTVKRSASRAVVTPAAVVEVPDEGDPAAAPR